MEKLKAHVDTTNTRLMYKVMETIDTPLRPLILLRLNGFGIPDFAPKTTFRGVSWDQSYVYFSNLDTHT